MKPDLANGKSRHPVASRRPEGHQGMLRRQAKPLGVQDLTSKGPGRRAWPGGRARSRGCGATVVAGAAKQGSRRRQGTEREVHWGGGARWAGCPSPCPQLQRACWPGTARFRPCFSTRSSLSDATHPRSRATGPTLPRPPQTGRASHSGHSLCQGPSAARGREVQLAPADRDRDGRQH